MALSNRTAPQVARREAVEESVLRATEELLAEGQSFADLGIERIATRAGISRTAFYFYFRDKRELLMRLTEDVATQLYSEAERWWAGAGDGAAELTLALRQIAALYREHDPLLRAVVEASAYDEDVASFWRALVGRFAESTRRRIEAEQAAGRAAGVPARATAFALTWMTERAFYQALVQPDAVKAEELVDGLAAIWLRSVYGTAPQAPAPSPPAPVAPADPADRADPAPGQSLWLT
jgi:AcrR family transcriptional regulator